jgi:signal peptidase I
MPDDVDRFRVTGISMTPILHSRQVVELDPTAFEREGPNRGDIIVFWLPLPQDGKQRRWIGRVVGLPGERVEVKEGAVFIDGQRLDEPYLQEPPIYTFRPRRRIPTDHYFVLGDNRNTSYDSSKWPSPWLPRGSLIAKVRSE